MYLFDSWPSDLPLIETTAGRGVDTLHLGQLPVPHLCVQEILKGQLLVLIVNVVPQLHLGGAKSHDTGDRRQR